MRGPGCSTIGCYNARPAPFVPARAGAARLPWAANVWMGVSVEDQRVVDRITDLQAVPAAVRFLSCEPLIGPLDALPLEGIHWVIVGGESGPKARPMQAAWVESIFRQCRAARVPFFFKQWGACEKTSRGASCTVAPTTRCHEGPARLLRSAAASRSRRARNLWPFRHSLSGCAPQSRRVTRNATCCSCTKLSGS